MRIIDEGGALMRNRIRAMMIVILTIGMVFVVVGLSAKDNFMNNQKVITADSPGKIPIAAQKRTDTLIVGSGSWNGNFNPIYESTLYDNWATTLIFDGGLMTNEDNGDPKPYMAKDYYISKDGKTYTFYINKNIRFSNGHLVTAKDFALTYQAIADPGYDGLRIDAVENLVGYEEYHNGSADSIKGIKVVNDYTIQFTEKSVKANALLQDFVYAPLDHLIYSFKKGQVRNIKNLFDTPVGAGPYKLVENKPEQYISFVRNEKYWKSAPKIEKIIMKLTNSSNQLQGLANGDVDIDSTIACKTPYIDYLKNLGFINLYIYPSNSYGYIGLNLRNPKFADKRVRQALMYGLDRESFVKSYYKDYGEVSNAPVSSVSWAYTTSVNQYKFNPVKAAQLLDQAGWKMNKDGFRYKNGEKFTIHWMTYTGSSYVEALIPVVEDCYKDLGIEVDPERMEFSTLNSKIFQTRNFEIYNMAWRLNIDPDQSSIFSKSQDVPGGGNSVGWVDSRSEKLMKDGLLELDQNKRKDIYQKWVKLVNEELPYLFISQGRSVYAASSRVNGLKVGPYRDWTVDIEKLSLLKN